ncbi:sigma factor [Novosphingobium sp.]|uniref:sigma factor n=1 Tax=Novosphingobium sp. TaxID=1874826 RepID=UPI0035B1A0C8
MMMKQDTFVTPLTLATLQREAKSGARRLVRRLCLCSDAQADICQELLVDLLARLRHFDPDRGTLGAFAGRIVANQSCCIAKRIIRERQLVPCTLEEAGIAANRIPEDRGMWAHLAPPIDPITAVQLRLDIARCGTRLTGADADLCSGLVEHGVSELVRQGLGSRSSIYRRIAELRALFAASGMASA